MSTLALGDIPDEEFRRAGHRLVDWITADFASSLARPVLSRVSPGEIRAALPDAAPERPEPFDEILADFERVLVPGLTQWRHPRYFAYFPCGFSAPGVLADMLSTAMSQQAMLWRTSPAGTELEEVTLGWLRRALSLPESFEGVIYDTASTSIVHALAAARQERFPEVRTRGLSGLPECRVYASEHAHSSADKAVITLGLGLDGLRRVAARSDLGMDPAALETAIEDDRRAGHAPLAVVATIGTTSAGSVDPVAAIADVCERHGLWLHVDAAYAGAAAILPECRELFLGSERADSFVLNPHKWLFTPFDLSVLYSPKMDVLRQAFALTPEYLKTTEASDVKNLMDTGFQLGRRFRSLKLWIVMRTFGLEGLRGRIREHMRLARLFANLVDAAPGFARAAPASFGVVCFRVTPSGLDDAAADGLNERLLHALNDSGEVFLSHTKLAGRYVLRMAIGSLRTTEADVVRAWELVTGTAARLGREAA